MDCGLCGTGSKHNTPFNSGDKVTSRRSICISGFNMCLDHIYVYEILFAGENIKQLIHIISIHSHLYFQIFSFHIRIKSNDFRTYIQAYIHMVHISEHYILVYLSLKIHCRLNNTKIVSNGNFSILGNNLLLCRTVYPRKAFPVCKACPVLPELVPVRRSKFLCLDRTFRVFPYTWDFPVGIVGDLDCMC